eukprot:TRINITY_DN31285_c0_g1_i1.p1 TRINITY_DN31285_c0_g1~~TRINITY_DN31285_c0_g1_i1.p1  ORF type:complete len:690 (-),score=198.65 TRINITY_DN31285_c0_g1_i1:142-2211(-)
MHRVLAFLLLSASAVLPCTQGSIMDEQEGPVRKIINLLQDMKSEIDADWMKDKDMHEKMKCWCERNKREKRQTIEVATERVESLTARVVQQEVKLEHQQKDLSETQQEYEANKAKLMQATELRKKEEREFRAVERDLLQAAAACQQAYTVLKKMNPTLEEMKAAAMELQTSKVLSLAQSGATDANSAAVLKDFVQDASRQGASFLANGMALYRRRGSETRIVMGVLENMKSDLEKDLKEARSDEKKAVKEFDELKENLMEQIGDGEARIKRLNKDIAALKELLVLDNRDLDDTKNSLTDSKQLLQQINKRCTQHETDYIQKEKDVSEESSALQEAIEILDSDEAFEVMGKTVSRHAHQSSFLQLSQASSSHRAAAKEAVALLQSVAKNVTSPRLVLLALRLQDDRQFDKVKNEMDKMIKHLGQTNTDEAAKRSWCISEMNENDRDTRKAEHEQARLKDEAATLKKAIKISQTDINASKDDLQLAQYALQEASLDRKAENAEFQRTVADQQTARRVLTKAKDTLKKVYSFIQARAQRGEFAYKLERRVQAAPSAPGKISEYKKSQSGKSALNMLEMLIEDTRKAEADAEKSEQAAESDYKELVEQSNKVLAEYQLRLSGQETQLADHQESAGRNAVNFQENMDELEAHSVELQQLHQECDWLVDKFQQREKARLEEINGLKKAKAVLTAM